MIYICRIHNVHNIYMYIYVYIYVCVSFHIHRIHLSTQHAMIIPFIIPRHPRHVTWPHPIDQSNVLVFSWSWWQDPTVE